MDIKERAKIRLQLGLSHNESYVGDYRRFADELEAAGLTASRQALGVAIDLTGQGNAAFRRALDLL